MPRRKHIPSRRGRVSTEKDVAGCCPSKENRNENPKWRILQKVTYDQRLVLIFRFLDRNSSFSFPIGQSVTFTSIFAVVQYIQTGESRAEVPPPYSGLSDLQSLGTEIREAEALHCSVNAHSAVSLHARANLCYCINRTYSEGAELRLCICRRPPGTEVGLYLTGKWEASSKTPLKRKSGDKQWPPVSLPANEVPVCTNAISTGYWQVLVLTQYQPTSIRASLAISR